MSALAHSWWSTDTFDRKQLREMERAAVVFECVGARLVEMRHV